MTRNKHVNYGTYILDITAKLSIYSFYVLFVLVGFEPRVSVSQYRIRPAARMAARTIILVRLKDHAYVTQL